MLYIIHPLLCAVYGFSFFKYVKARRIGLWLGVNTGISYLILIPLGVLLASGEIVQVEDPRRGFYINAVVSRDYLGIFKIELMLLIYGCFDLLSHNFARFMDGRPASERQKGPAVIPPSLLYATALGVGVSLFILSGLSSGAAHWSKTKEDFFEDAGVFASIILTLQMSTRVAMLVALTVLVLAKRMTLKSFIVWLGLFCVIDLYTTGNRIFILQTMFVGALIVLTQRRFRLATVIGISAIPLGVLMNLWGPIRSQMHNRTGSGISGIVGGLQNGWDLAMAQQYNLLSPKFFLLGVTEGGSMSVFVMVTKLYPSEFSYLGGSTLLKAFVFWIPRSIWPAKPIGAPSIVGHILLPDTGTSLAMSIFGEFYINFGVVGVLLIPVLLWVLLRGFWLIGGHPATIGVAGFVFGLTVVRMSIANVMLSFIFVFLLLRFTNFGFSPGSDTAPTARPDAGSVR